MIQFLESPCMIFSSILYRQDTTKRSPLMPMFSLLCVEWHFVITTSCSVKRRLPSKN